MSPATGARRSLTHRLDVGQHIGAPSYARTDYYPFLLAAVKGGVALMLALLAWRIVKAHAAERAARRLIARLGADPHARAPRMRIELSPRLWLLAFTVTSVFALVHLDAEQAAAGRWPLLWPWLHTSTLPIFAVLAVLVSLVWGAVSNWLSEYERYAHETCARANRLASASTPAPAPASSEFTPPPRKLFGLAFESRPPPLPA